MKKFTIPALIIALGISVLGLFIYSAARTIVNSQRTVTVRGLSQREVKSDLAIYTLSCSFDGENLQQLYRSLTAQNELLVNYLKEKGFKEEEITVTSPYSHDNTDNYNYKAGITPHYSISNSVKVTSEDADAIEQLAKCDGELMARGLFVSTSVYYKFNGLNEIKPEMIEEATKNARQVAEKFAKDSGSKIGKIQSATQGQFSIFTNSPESDYSFDDADSKMKNVRVVTTMIYELN